MEQMQSTPKTALLGRVFVPGAPGLLGAASKSACENAQGDGLSIIYFRTVWVGMGMRPHHSLGLRVSGLLEGVQWVWGVCRSLSGE